MESQSSQKQESNWDWIDSKCGPYLQSKLLIEKGFKHGFFSNQCNNRTPKELAGCLNQFSSIHLAKQVHGNKVIEASQACKEPWPEADSLVSDRTSQSLWIYSADCIPILFADPINGYVAACHAGWKGISKNIIIRTIEKLEKFGSNRKTLIVALGPAISREKYQIGFSVAKDVFKNLGKSYENSTKDRALIISKMFALGLINYDKVPNRFRLDIRQGAALQLRNAGLFDEQISINKSCTFSEPNLFNSWRRDQIKRSQWSGILSKKINSEIKPNQKVQLVSK